MHTSCEGFACIACGGSMEQMDGVPVLQSLQGHAIHRCAECGHILLVPVDSAGERSVGWLTPLMELKLGIACAAMV